MHTFLGSPFIIALLAVASFSKQSVSSYAPDPSWRVLRIAVTSDGTIALNGADVSLSALRDALAAAAETKAVVWYYRENAQGEAPEEASPVIQAVIDNRLPISLSTEPDFSTVVSEDGTVKAR